MGRAVPKRRREFQAGRWAARHALRALGGPTVAIPVAADRSPVWPAGVLGSITHTDSVCLALVARVEHVALLGVDLEPDQPLFTGLLDSICVDEERRWLATQVDPARLGRVIFAAKEAVYKALSPSMRTVIGFDAVAVSLAPDVGAFEATLRYDVPGFPKGFKVRGRWVVEAGLILTLVLHDQSP